MTFATGASYWDVDNFLQALYPKYKPHNKTTSGIPAYELLGNVKVLFGHKFTKVVRVNNKTDWLSLYSFIHDNLVGTFFVCKPHHAFVVKDGDVYDLNDVDYSAPVDGAWKVEKVA